VRGVVSGERVVELDGPGFIGVGDRLVCVEGAPPAAAELVAAPPPHAVRNASSIAQIADSAIRSVVRRGCGVLIGRPCFREDKDECRRL